MQIQTEMPQRAYGEALELKSNKQLRDYDTQSTSPLQLVLELY